MHRVSLSLTSNCYRNMASNFGLAFIDVTLPVFDIINTTVRIDFSLLGSLGYLRLRSMLRASFFALPCWLVARVLCLCSIIFEPAPVTLIFLAPSLLVWNTWAITALHPEPVNWAPEPDCPMLSFVATAIIFGCYI
ncbi:hypothetical protein SAMN06265379_102327 [Saccharicrinis carchari]|uniref:Uncharacterized protein n=1 Tax=Saccharicrinis carchari TaxID=1168039 RepID=A0A521C1S7_SACCC|nr:hypothetical protein SAMN06265379_102327 [Saccharicrinis carchari]